MSRLISAFGNAGAGWRHAVASQPNARIHLFITAAVIVLGLWLRLDARDWAILSLATGLVWAAELMNTAVETVVDLANPEEHALAGRAKDLSAGSVLAAALAAALTGVLVLLPPLLQRLQ